jgi:quercetin dioxygenase-like cupin family protein
MINLYKNENLKWKRFQGGDNFDYPIDYSAALLNANKDGHVDILYKWEPNSYCHFHRHTAEVSSTVLSGDLYVIDIDLASGKETGSKIRHAGDYAHKKPGDVHMEKAGPEGALVLFNLFAPDGLLAESMNKDGSVIGRATVDQFFKSA